MIIPPLITNRGGGIGSLVVTSAIWLLIMIGAAFPSRAEYAQKAVAQLNGTLRILKTQQPKPELTKRSRPPTSRQRR